MAAVSRSLALLMAAALIGGLCLYWLSATARVESPVETPAPTIAPAAPAAAAQELATIPAPRDAEAQSIEASTVPGAPASAAGRAAVSLGLRVVVRDALTQEPVPDAELLWLPADAFSPTPDSRARAEFWLRSKLGQQGHRATTDATGTALVSRGARPVLLGNRNPKGGTVPEARWVGPDEAEFSLEWVRATRFALRVTGPGGRPVVGLAVDLTFDSVGRSPARFEPDDLTDADGRWNSEVPSADLARLLAHADRGLWLHLGHSLDSPFSGRAPQASSRVRWSLQSPVRTERTVELPPHGSLTVVVSPVADDGWPRPRTVELVPTLLEPGRSSPNLQSVPLDPTGRAHFAVVPLGGHLTARYGSEQRTCTGPQVDGERVELHLSGAPTGARLQAQITGASGEPRRRMSIELRLYPSPQGAPFPLQSRTDADGRLDCELPVGPVGLPVGTQLVMGRPSQDDEGAVAVLPALAAGATHDLGTVGIEPWPIVAAGRVACELEPDAVLRILTGPASGGDAATPLVVEALLELGPQGEFSFAGFLPRLERSSRWLDIEGPRNVLRRWPLVPGSTDLVLDCPTVARVALSLRIAAPLGTAGGTSNYADPVRSESDVDGRTRYFYEYDEYSASFERAQVRAIQFGRELGRHEVMLDTYGRGWQRELSWPGAGTVHLEFHHAVLPTVVVEDVELVPGEVTRDARLLPLDLQAALGVEGRFVEVRVRGRPEGESEEGEEPSFEATVCRIARDGAGRTWGEQRSSRPFLPEGGSLNVWVEADGHYAVHLPDLREDLEVRLEPGGEVMVQVVDVAPDWIVQSHLEPSAALRARCAPHRPEATSLRYERGSGLHSQVSVAGEWEVVLTGRTVDQDSPRELARVPIQVRAVPEAQEFRVAGPR
jgi:hypothetical protein